MAPDLLVIGGTGFLGRRLVTQAAAAGLGVHATGRTGATGTDDRWHRVDLVDGGDDAAMLIAELRPAAVINAAYVQSGVDLDAVTARAPAAIAAGCASVGARLVHISSDVVFDGELERAYTESDPVAPVHEYGVAKATAERLVGAAAPDAAIVRTSLLWSLDDGGGLQVALVRDPSVRFFTDEIRNPIRVDRLATAVLELAGRPEVVGPIHLAGADAVDRLTFARALAPLAGRDADDLRGSPSDPTSRRPRRLALDSSLAGRILAAPLPGVRDDAPAATH